MALTHRSDGAIVSWTNSLGVIRPRGSIIVDNLLLGVALGDIMPLGEERWEIHKEPAFDTGSVARCGLFEVPFHLRDSVNAYQQAYYNQIIDRVTDTPGSTATLPQPSVDNVGRTMVSPIYTSDEVVAEEWFLDFQDLSTDNTGLLFSIWRLAGSVSGTISDAITTGAYWTDSTRKIGFKITDLDITNFPPGQNDRFIFYTSTARRKFGIFASQYPASAQSGFVLLDSKIPIKTDHNGKFYR